MPGLFLQNKNYDIYEQANGDCYVKEKLNRRYFFKKNLFASSKYAFDEVHIVRWGVRDNILTILVVISLCLLFFLIKQEVSSPIKTATPDSLYIIAFMCLNLILHEGGHAVALIFLGQHPGKIRFKWYYIFPLISVDTSDVYIMPKYRGMFVCYAGVMVNIYLCSLVMILRPELSYLLPPVYTLILFSLIPFSGVKTDGYNLFIRLILGVNDVKGRRSKLSKYLELLLNVTLVGIVGHYVYGVLS